MERHVQTRFDLLYPDISQKVESQQLKHKLSHDDAKPVRSFQVDDLVYAENFLNSPPKWIQGKVVKVDSVRSRRPNTTVELCDSGQVDPLILPDLHPTLPTVPSSEAAPLPTPTTPPTSLPPVSTATTTAKPRQMRCDRKERPNYCYK